MIHYTSISVAFLKHLLGTPFDMRDFGYSFSLTAKISSLICLTEMIGLLHYMTHTSDKSYRFVKRIRLRFTCLVLLPARHI